MVVEKILFRLRGREKMVSSLAGSLDALYFYLPENEPEMSISSGRAKLDLPKKLSSFLGFSKPKKREVTIAIHAGERSIQIACESRRAEFQLEGEGAGIKVKIFRGEEKFEKPDVPLELFKQVVEVGNKVVALCQSSEPDRLEEYIEGFR